METMHLEVDNYEHRDCGISTATLAREVLFAIVEELRAGGQLKVVLTVPECAKLIGVHNARMYEIVRIESFPRWKCGNRILIPLVPFLDWIEQAGRSQLEV